MCEQVKLKIHIFYEHMTLAWINMIDKHHTKVMKCNTQILELINFK
jgi:hypothetical protein